MKIAVLSDIHDNVWTLSVALKTVESADAMVCCGDLCSPFVVDQLARGFAKPLYIVFGNNDADLFRITGKAKNYPEVRLKGEFFVESFDGRSVAVNHYDSIAMEIVRADFHDAVFFGHNHRYQNGVPGTKTLALNPGSIMGAQFDVQANRTDVSPTFAIYDTVTNRALGYRIDGAVARPMQTH